MFTLLFQMFSLIFSLTCMLSSVQFKINCDYFFLLEIIKSFGVTSFLFSWLLLLCMLITYDIFFTNLCRQLYMKPISGLFHWRNILKLVMPFIVRKWMLLEQFRQQPTLVEKIQIISLNCVMRLCFFTFLIKV